VQKCFSIILPGQHTQAHDPTVRSLHMYMICCFLL